jgi:hypothetical protein
VATRMASLEYIKVILQKIVALLASAAIAENW